MNTPAVAQVTGASGSQIAADAIEDFSFATQLHAFAQVTVTTAAATLASLLTAAGGTVTAIPPWATMAFIVPTSGNIVYRADGTAPTAAIGMPIAQGQAWPIQGQAALNALQLVATGNVTVAVEFRG